MNHSQQHPSIEIDDAAYPSDSNYSPANHPSSSISNAAYPSNSSYRPSDPTTSTDDKLAMPNARYSQSYDAGSGASSRSNNNNNIQLVYPSYPPSAAQSPLGWAHSPTHDPLLGSYSPARSPVTPWSPDGMSAANPNLPPPPPYDASRTSTGTNPPTPRDPVSPNSSERALLGSQQSRQQRNAAHPPRPQSTHFEAPQQSPAPAEAHVAGAPPEQGERGGPRTYLQSMTGGMPAYGSNPGQLGPVAQARRRRKVKLGILVGVLCAVLLFLVALVVGILLGVVKLNKDDKFRLPPPPPPPPPGFGGS
ncbi:uncharacterized protein LY79DRAFT_593691 [Colletotrichum navitas]|uniref:Uncharacterized protein n=1 Tax=Colletotrichum navitas TaxID=681940 RepID=A0AAD8PQA4_9PEZI|nr:uncharacterized protein LY79DRAFT_593691 [Colletotrichum navitas]KAK1573799.1 hypothetical protein LY79DRAFT_593691 [Colletotrichum navitas]